ncbi:response regulator [Alphaproteobacteria bacterium HT1-32]|nr:response regulator [Alphaproteobacteria bacterium HT1-32]
MHPLQNLTVLLVEDTWQIRNLLTSILTQLGFGKVIRASNGAEAIQLIKLMRDNPVKAGFSNIDLVLSDWVMDPVDGPMLLRWIRRHKESPDRFMPFVMISAYSDDARVEMARDLGVNEFLSKPFTVREVARHLEAVVRDGREFCRTSIYFGPNRRRKREAPDMGERRVHKKNGDVIKSSKDFGIRFYPQPRTLISKLVSGGDISPDVLFDWDKLEDMEQDLDRFSEDFMDWTAEYLQQLQVYYKAAADLPEDKRKPPLVKISMIAHELRGQGGVFGYPLISSIAESLFDLTHQMLDRSDDSLKLVKEHLDALKAVLREKVRGDGGGLGIALMQALQMANRKFISRSKASHLVSRRFVLQNSYSQEDLDKRGSEMRKPGHIQKFGDQPSAE